MGCYKMSPDRRRKCSLPVKCDVLLLPETFRKLWKRKEGRSRGRIREIKMIILSKYARKTVQEILLILTCGKVQL